MISRITNILSGKVFFKCRKCYNYVLHVSCRNGMLCGQGRRWGVQSSLLGHHVNTCNQSPACGLEEDAALSIVLKQSGGDR